MNLFLVLYTINTYHTSIMFSKNTEFTMENRLAIFYQKLQVPIIISGNMYGNLSSGDSVAVFDVALV